ncbi:tRNA (adenine(22)-N(1))-methyltransferase [Desertibacillus haloalkaliphilus]|uniref:tRNA (adenine(22)-N(1))-methyltransferase n=1 Tax=Desertibacillus haloalkaliphilus TaxID=1328930 RepID=UPI001C27F528|nr:tRNA (adenine(22)-N(1))-methyltransferase TrmK [Desertibacillus haloalkaliphilus]MBU8905683.1 tRNA (adenine(22)-N(1))-methyltransferase TrmK [Desertibacillus haloalkaliphilus]
MNEVNLSDRLLRVANHVPQGAKVADIGSDHAYLPCYLCLEGIIDAGVAGEVNEGPFQSALSQVKKVGLEQQIEVRKGNGLEVIEQGEVDVITIAGMGGPLIRTILDEGKDKLNGVKKLILQPNIAADKLRIWLKDQSWALVSEEIFEEDEKIYELLIAEKGDGSRPYEEDLETEFLLGPYLMREKNAAFRKKWDHELANWKKVLSQFEHAQHTPEMIAKKADLQRKIDKVEEVLS